MDEYEVLYQYRRAIGGESTFPAIDDISKEFFVDPSDNPYKLELHRKVHRHYVHVLGQNPERTRTILALGNGQMDQRYNNILSYSFSMQDPPSYITSWGIRY